MFEIVKYKKEHLLPLLKENINHNLSNWLDADLSELLENCNSVTIMSDRGPLVCGGITDYWPGRGQVWCVFSEKSKINFLSTFRLIKRWIDQQLVENYHRIELSVNCDFDKGKRRAEMLGFQLECLKAKKYLPDGEDCTLYAKVRE